MRFGGFIRNVRRDLKWTQPQAAKKIGIEQSYLSKLESGKSYPSEDVFSSLMQAYNFDLVDLNHKLFPADLDRLREISEVRAIILTNKKDVRKKVQNWVIAGVITLMMGGACLGTSFLAKDREVTQFQYKSEGVTHYGEGEGESVNGFDVVGDDASEDQTLQLQHQEMTNRIDEKYLSHDEYKGVVFFENAPEGTRTWRFYGSKQDMVRSPLRWFMIPAIALIFGGVGCFFASSRTF